jgi:hypothetical protein
MSLRSNVSKDSGLLSEKLSSVLVLNLHLDENYGQIVLGSSNLQNNT